MTNRFQTVVDETQNAPESQRLDRAITAIAKELQQSQNQGVAPSQMGQELNQIRPQLVKALQQA